MKKLMLTVAAVTCASIVSAQTTTSQNIVGYTKVTVDGGDLALIAVNFDSPTTIADLIGSSVPALSVVYKWDKGSNGYVTSTLSARGGWSPNSTLELGDAFFLAPAGAGTHDIIVPGEVLLTDATNAIPAGIVATGISFPISQAWQSTALSGDLPGLSVLNLWDQVGQGYTTVTKSARGAWSSNPTVNPADGFFVENSGAAFDSVETNPIP